MLIDSLGRKLNFLTTLGFFMALSMFEASVPVFSRRLTSLLAIIDKALAHCEARKIDDKILAASRLFPDMLPFTSQVNIACDTVKFAAARLAGVEAPKHEDNQMTLAESAARIRSVLEFLAQFQAGQINGSEEKDISIPMRTGAMQMKGQAYLLDFVLPNFYFHMTTAYALLRHNGVEVGKKDFLGRP
jgi:uncharacterized protein